MNDAKQEIVEALRILSALAVSGEAVEVIAAVRSKMKKAIKLLEVDDG